MAEFREEPAQSFIVRAHCSCGSELEHDGQGIQLTSPPGVGYRCPACGASETLPEYYPKVIARPVAEQ